jgi:hypothetical protein
VKALRPASSHATATGRTRLSQYSDHHAAHHSVTGARPEILTWRSSRARPPLPSERSHVFRQQAYRPTCWSPYVDEPVEPLQGRPVELQTSPVLVSVCMVPGRIRTTQPTPLPRAASSRPYLPHAHPSAPYRSGPASRQASCGEVEAASVDGPPHGNPLQTGSGRVSRRSQALPWWDLGRDRAGTARR